MKNTSNKILITADFIHMFIDISFFKKYFDVEEYIIQFYGEEGEKVLEKKLESNKYDIIFLPKIGKLQEDRIRYFHKITEIYKNTLFVCVDTLYPHVETDKYKELFYRKNVITISDFQVGEFPNSIEVPLFGITNADVLSHQQLTGSPYKKGFQIWNTKDSSRIYDVMFKVGKPKFTRLVVSALMKKNKLKNHYTNISFSKETGMITNQFKNDINEFWNDCFTHFSWPIDLKEYLLQIPIETHIERFVETNIKHQGGAPQGYCTDISSFADIYMESETCEIFKTQYYNNFVAFTEKTFNNFYLYKIPLAVDTRNNIEYLKKVGFEFPIEPCYIELDDTHLTFTEKVDSWLNGLKKYDFKKMWNDMYYTYGCESPLHKNYELCNEFFMKKNPIDNTINSKPQYIATYLFLKNHLPEYLENYINYDYKTYSYLKFKNLL